MKVLNECKISFKSKSVNEGFARTTVAAFLAQLDPTIDQMADVKTAVSEAVTNAIVHGYGDILGTINIKMKITDKNDFVISIQDKGVGILDIKRAMEPMFTTGNKEERAGLGFAVMETFMDSLKVYSKPDKGTRIVMKKNID